MQTFNFGAIMQTIVAAFEFLISFMIAWFNKSLNLFPTLRGFYPVLCGLNNCFTFCPLHYWPWTKGSK